VAGAVAAFLLHAGTDWDLLVPGLTVPFLLCCAALLVSRADAPRVVLASPKRLLLVAAAGLLALVAGIGLMGNQQLHDSYSAAQRGDFRAAEQHASDAARWQPWSFLPWMQLGNARWALGDVAGARNAYRTAASKEPGRMEPALALAEISSGTAQQRAVQRVKLLNPIGPELTMLCNIAPRSCP
jgi:cytochrome c-type biogenesis protein CcmH/NrfG